MQAVISSNYKSINHFAQNYPKFSCILKTEYLLMYVIVDGILY